MLTKNIDIQIIDFSKTSILKHQFFLKDMKISMNQVPEEVLFYLNRIKGLCNLNYLRRHVNHM